MNEKHTVLKNKYLEATVRLPSNEPISQRFDDAGIVEQIIFNERHRFCQPEQIIPKKETTNGIGLCSEFIWNELAKDTPPGTQFPKFGVGLLTQRSEGGDYNRWAQYDIEPYKRSYKIYEDRVEFTQYPKICMGLAARILKAVQINANTITITTTILNEGEKPLDMSEYQHNFIAINDIPIGPGYNLKIPYDRTLSEVKNCVYSLSGNNDKTQVLPDMIDVENHTITWLAQQTETEIVKITEESDILTLPQYKWTLSHDEHSVKISEICHFSPSKIILWGIEHTVCVEAFCKISVPMNGRQTFARTWVFEDE